MTAPAHAIVACRSLAAEIGLGDDGALRSTAPCEGERKREISYWAASGLGLLTGAHGRAPIFPERGFAGRLAGLLRRVEVSAARVGARLDLDWSLFTERAAALGLRRGGRRSCNRRSRLLRAGDGWLAVSLARQDDLDALPAWIGEPCAGDPWRALARAARACSADEFAERGQDLGVPAARVDARRDPQLIARASEVVGGVRLQRLGRGCARTIEWGRRRPLVLDLSSLWAGPLCGHLLTLAGARVVKVESCSRPDGARYAAPAFFDRLHQRQESVALDFAAAVGRRDLARLIARADVVIESTRPRALEQLGIDVEACFKVNPALVWISVTAFGRTGPWSNRVGFGDDAAAAGGLIGEDSQADPVFVGDALADPITGLAAAAAAFASISAGGGILVDAALREAAAFIADAPLLQGAKIVGRAGAWRIRCEGFEAALAPPSARPVAGAAAAMGAHTAAVLTETS